MFFKKITIYKYKISTAVVLIITAAVIFFSCTKDKGTLQSSCNIPATVSFSKDIIPVFKQNCSTSGCHSGSNPAGNLNLDSAVAYTKLNKPGSGYLDTIQPNYSLLYSQMISTSNPMPPTGKLNGCTTSLILKWIEQKAKDN